MVNLKGMGNMGIGKFGNWEMGWEKRNWKRYRKIKKGTGIVELGKWGIGKWDGKRHGKRVGKLEKGWKVVNWGWEMGWEKGWGKGWEKGWELEKGGGL